MDNARIIAQHEARLSEPPAGRQPIAEDYGSGDEIYVGDEVMDLGDGRLVLNDVEHLQEALQQALGLRNIDVYRIIPASAEDRCDSI